MRKKLARALWATALSMSIGVAGCSSSKDDAKDKVTKNYPGKQIAVDKKGEAAADMVAPRGHYKRKMMPKPGPPGPPPVVSSSEDYKNYGVNPMVDTTKDRLSTFAVDVDTASYAIARRKILAGKLPPSASVRVEEWVNYFKYSYDGPTGDKPFAVHMDGAPSPFHSGHHLVRVGVQAKKLSRSERKKANLVFLVDVSGSMRSADKLGLAKRALRILVNNLKDGDTVSLVTYAGSTRVVLPPTGLEHKAQIFNALQDLTAGGGTGMASGIKLAYEQAAKKLSKDSISRVIVLSDGDANIGQVGHDKILDMIKDQVDKGVTMTAIGLGMGNYKDSRMEQLANKGNGNYFYIDGLSQAKRTFQEQLGSTLQVVAKDVKIQVEFDPKLVKRYRLVGYENRKVADRDFRNDKVDAGEIGAGHTVTAIYEVELRGNVDKTTGQLGTVRIRAKKPDSRQAIETAYPLEHKSLATGFDKTSKDFRFAVAVMATAEILRKSPHAKSWELDKAAQIAKSAADGSAERKELSTLIEKVKPLRKVATLIK